MGLSLSLGLQLGSVATRSTGGGVQYGPELVVNGTASGWSAAGGASLYQSPASIIVTNGSAAEGRATKAIVTAVGSKHRLQVDNTGEGVFSASVLVFDTVNNTQTVTRQNIASGGKLDIEFVATSGAAQIWLLTNSAVQGQARTFANVSCQVKLADLVNDFGTKADGVPTLLDSGQTWFRTKVEGLQHVQSLVVGGKLIQPPNPNQYATNTYTGVGLGKIIREMTMEISFDPGSDASYVAALPIAANDVTVQSIVGGSFHPQFTHNACFIGYFDGVNQSQVVNETSFNYTGGALVCDGATKYTVGWRLVDDQMFILEPNGSWRAVSVSAACKASSRRPGAIFEHTRSPPATGRVNIHRTTARVI